jgi:hypothetical protein
MIASMKEKFPILLFYAIFIGAPLLAACAAPGQVAVNTPQGRSQIYPPALEDTPQRRQAAEDAWKKFIAEFQLPEAKLDLEPVLNTPRALPLELAGRVALNTKPGVFGELEAKEALRRFIERASGVLFPDHTNGSSQGSVSLKDLSLDSFANDGNFYRAVYRQASYPFPIANGYGELRLTVAKNGTLLQWNSRIIPVFDLPTRPEITAQSTQTLQSIRDRMVGRTFNYTNIAGQPMSYKVRDRSEVSIKDLVVYPKPEGNRIRIHLAYPVEVGSGMTWTVYVDAITGQEIDVKQNFVS